MRFMIIVKADANSEAGAVAPAEEIAAMGVYNEELINAGILLGAEGLQASSKGARVKFGEKGTTTIIDGPFTEAKELVAGFWLIQAKSRDEAIAWAARAPMRPGDELEVRQVFDASDFPADRVSEEALAKEKAWRDADQKPLTN